jgi:alpha-methylacyl-CoA racemase
VPCYNVYRTSDDRFMAVGALEFKFWETCCEALGRPDLAKRHWSREQQIGGDDAKAVKAELDAIFALHPLAYWTEKFAGKDCCVTPILRMDEAVAHPLFREREMIKRSTHPTEGEFWQTGCNVKFKP